MAYWTDMMNSFGKWICLDVMVLYDLVVIKMIFWGKGFPVIMVLLIRSLYVNCSVWWSIDENSLVHRAKKLNGETISTVFGSKVPRADRRDYLVHNRILFTNLMISLLASVLSEISLWFDFFEIMPSIYGILSWGQ